MVLFLFNVQLGNKYDDDDDDIRISGFQKIIQKSGYSTVKRIFKLYSWRDRLGPCMDTTGGTADIAFTVKKTAQNLFS